MAINRKLLESLSPDHVIRASTFLNHIFVQDKIDISFSLDDDLHVFSTLIQASSDNVMKQKLFFSLSVTAQKKCFVNLTYSTQYQLLISTHNTQLLVSLFLLLEPSLQHEFLTNCFNTHINIFKKIKHSLKPSFFMQHGLIIEKSKITSQQLDSYRNTLFSYIKDSSFTVHDVSTFVESLQNTLDNDDLNNFIESTLRDFYRLKLPLSSKDQFASYLKFFTISVPFIVMFPNHTSYLDSILDHFLWSLNSIKSDSWILKILNQLPLYILKKCCTSISVYEKIKDNKKRNIYMKFYKLIHDHIQSGCDDNVTMTMNQV